MLNIYDFLIMLCCCLWIAVYYFVYWAAQLPYTVLYEALWSSMKLWWLSGWRRLWHPCVDKCPGMCKSPAPAQQWSTRRLIIRLNGVRGRGLLIVCQGPGNNWDGRNENIIQIFENLSAQMHRYFLYTSINNCMTANSPNQFIWLEIIACTESRGSEMFTMGI